MGVASSSCVHKGLVLSSSCPGPTIRGATTSWCPFAVFLRRLPNWHVHSVYVSKIDTHALIYGKNDPYIRLRLASSLLTLVTPYTIH
jgi:hypothetical protein